MKEQKKNRTCFSYRKRSIIAIVNDEILHFRQYMVCGSISVKDGSCELKLMAEVACSAPLVASQHRQQVAGTTRISQVPGIGV